MHAHLTLSVGNAVTMVNVCRQLLVYPTVREGSTAMLLAFGELSSVKVAFRENSF